MPINVKCPDCGQSYRLSESLAGKKAKCKACNGTILIPLDDADDLVELDEPRAKPVAKKPAAPPPLPVKAASPPPKPPPVPKAAAAAPLPKISVTCDMCFSDFQAKGELAGKKMKCPECGEPVAVPASKAKSKAKAKPQDDDDDLYADVIEAEEDDYDAPPVRRGAKDKKKKSKGSKRSGQEYFLDKIPIPALLGGMWVLIAVGCTMLVLFGKSSQNGAAMAGGDGNWNAGNGASPAVVPAQSGPAVQPYDLAAIPVPTLPELGPMIPGPGGFVFSEVQFNGGNVPGGSMRIRLRMPAVQLAPRTIGCILVGSAGTPMIHGTGLDELSHTDESLPYIQAGFAVCEYSMDGPLNEEAEDEEVDLKRAYEQFAAADAGLVNVRNAVEFILAKVPQVHPNRLYIAGHSSAGATALLAAAHEPRIKACIAYCAPTNLLKQQQELLTVYNFNGFKPEIREFLQRSSPLTHAERINCPVFLFHGTGDDVVPVSESTDMHNRLMQLGKSAILRTVTSNDHYESMSQQGLPLAIIWLREQATEKNPDAPDASTGTAIPGNVSSPVTAAPTDN